MDTLLKMLTEHVYLILFVSLILEFVALPIPGETMMALAGVMGYEGHANYWLMVIAGSLGTIIGMQVSYEVGSRLGTRAIKKYGKYIGLTKPRMEQATKFFNKYGNIVIFVAYYLPGVRHILGYFSGISKIDPKKFHIYSTVGGIVWVFTFITMGYILGPSWKHVFHIVHKYGGIVFVLALIGLFVYLIYQKLGKLEFLKDLKKYSKYYITFLLLIILIDISLFIFYKHNMRMLDDVLMISLGVILTALIIYYVILLFNNRTSEKLLVVVDYQNDFVDGALLVQKSEKLESVIKNKIEHYIKENNDVIFTLDTHEEDYLETREGKFLPVLHCIRETKGHKLFGEIKDYKDNAKKIFEKETFGSLDLAKYVSRSNYKKVEVCGLVSNICVLSNIVLLQTFNEDIEIIVDLKATLSNDEEVNKTLEIYLKALGVTVVK